MLKNYLMTALRSFTKQKGYSLINITGLSIGMVCCLLILMYVNDELGYDAYNEKADRTYRVASSVKWGGRDLALATVPTPMAATLVNEYPEVETATRFRDKGSLILKYGENSFKERKLIYSDPAFFDVFTIPLQAGDPKTALKEPYTLILSKNTAEKYFGNQNPLGKIIKVDNKDDYKITGVYDRIPRNTHFHFDIIASMTTLEESRKPQWLSNNFTTYIVLKENVEPATLESKFPGIIKKYMAPQIERFMGKSIDELEKSGQAKIEFYLQKLTDIHLHSDLMTEIEANGDIRYVYIFSAIAIFVLLIAFVNFMNLSTARSVNRAREIGIRKVLGSQRSQLVRQFLAESMLFSVISMITAIILLKFALPYFSDLAGKEFVMSDFFTMEMIQASVLITLLTGFMAGTYPAFFISAYQPAKVLKGQIKSGNAGSRLRSVLVVFQFTASIVLIIGTIVVMKQLDYIQDRDLGFDREQVFVLQNAYLLGHRAEAFKNEMLEFSQVKNATVCGYLPVKSQRDINGVFPEGKGANKSTAVHTWVGDRDYIKTMGMKIVKGRGFLKDYSTDTDAVIVNESAVEQFEWKEPVGKRIRRKVSVQGDEKVYTVIGVVKDFHFDTFKNTIAPLVLFMGESNERISFRLEGDEIAGTIALIREKWEKFLPGQPFEYTFLDEDFNKTYRAERQMGKIIATFAILAVLIGCLGLLGLAAFISGQRTREIGIRKALGATVPGIVRLLSKDFIILVAISNIIAWPLAYWTMKQWLQDFAYRTGVGVGVFLAAGLISLVIAMATVSYQSIKAALANPVESLKHE